MPDTTDGDGGTDRLELLGAPYTMSVGGKPHPIDMLLRRASDGMLVAVSLSDGPFDPGMTGRMGFTLAMLDDLVREPAMPLSVGLIACQGGDQEVSRLSLKATTARIAMIDRDDLPPAVACHVPSAPPSPR